MDTFDWSTYAEPTSSGIVQEILKNDPEKKEKENRVKDRFVALLKEARPTYPGDFQPINGVSEFLSFLIEKTNHQVAIATGGFDTEAEFKLRCCGINLVDYPHATSSDTPKRKNIIPLAAERAGFPISSCVYFGDALWDIKVSRELNIPLIGIGRKREIFIRNDHQDHFRDYSDLEAIWRLLETKTINSNKAGVGILNPSTI